MGSKSSPTLIQALVIPLFIMIILMACTFRGVWIKNDKDSTAYTKVKLSKMEVVTYNAEGAKRVEVTELKRYCDVDEKNIKCILYKGSKATIGLTAVTLVLTAGAIVALLVPCVIEGSDCEEISTVAQAALTALAAAFSFLAFVTYTSYSSDFRGDNYSLSTGWSLSLVSFIGISCLILPLSCVGVCVTIK